MKQEAKKWEIKVKLIDIGEPFFSDITKGKVRKYFLSKDDIQYKLRLCCFPKMTGIGQFKNLEVKRIK